jgi:hypothetical protein
MSGAGESQEHEREVVVAALLRASGGQALVTVAEAAAALPLTPEYLYENRERLGGVRLGFGRKARSRFDAETLQVCASFRAQAAGDSLC